MSRTIESILAGSCTPAHDLLLQIRHYGMDAAAADVLSRFGVRS
jgi:hypothetical protein